MNKAEPTLALNPEETSPEIQNRGTSGHKKRTCVRQKLFKKRRLYLMIKTLINKPDHYEQVIVNILHTFPPPYFIWSICLQFINVADLNAVNNAAKTVLRCHKASLRNKQDLSNPAIRQPTLALKPRGDVTRNPKQGYQWPQNRTHVSAKKNF